MNFSLCSPVGEKIVSASCFIDYRLSYFFDMGGRRFCSYPYCDHKKKTHQCKLHAFPKDPERCLLWLAACGLSVSPGSLPISRYVCLCHFVGGLGLTEEYLNPLPFSVSTCKRFFFSSSNAVGKIIILVSHQTDPQDDYYMDDDEGEPPNPPANVSCADNSVTCNFNSLSKEWLCETKLWLTNCMTEH